MASSMSDQKFIKSFSIFLVLGVVLTLFLIFLGNLNAGTINDQVRDGRNAMAEAGNNNSLQPIGQISVAGDEAAQAETVQVAAATIDGTSVYQNACMACHAAGIAGAPRVGDAAAWAERIAQGNDTLYTNAIQRYDRAPHLLIGFPTRFLPRNKFPDRPDCTEPLLIAGRDG